MNRIISLRQLAFDGRGAFVAKDTERRYTSPAESSLSVLLHDLDFLMRELGSTALANISGQLQACLAVVSNPVVARHSRDVLDIGLCCLDLCAFLESLRALGELEESSFLCNVYFAEIEFALAKLNDLLVTAFKRQCALAYLISSSQDNALALLKQRLMNALSGLLESSALTASLEVFDT